MTPGASGARDSEGRAYLASRPTALTALAHLGIDPVRCEFVSPLGIAKGRRCAVRVEGADGRSVKVRCYENAAAATRVEALRAGLESAFAPVIARADDVLVEQWIEGRRLAADEESAWAAPAGALLGRLHRMPLPHGEPREVAVEPWVERTAANLDLLARAGHLDRDLAGSLRRRAAERAPRSAPTALAHLDLCAENMILDGSGTLRVIDNEMVEIRPPGFDLARSLHLWPLPRAARARFVDAYRAARGADAENLDFWWLVALALGARIFLDVAPGRRDACLAGLRAVLADGAGDDPA